jgi:alkaline phosphatase isozyme conversion protein
MHGTFILALTQRSADRAPSIRSFLLIACLGACLGLSGCSPELEGGQGSTVAAGLGRLARQHIEILSDSIGNRTAGSEGESQAAAYIEGVFEGLGYPVSVQTFTFAGGPRGRRSTLQSANVVAVKQGASERELIVGAHYDAQGDGRGAGDNASGVGVMLEVAEVIRDLETPYTIRFVAFGAEEVGRVGSRHYVSQMSPQAIATVIAMINLDSLIAGDFAYIYGSAGEGGFLRDWILRRAEREGRDLRTQTGENPEYPAGTTGDFSDHGPFEDAGMQYAYFESTNWGLGDKDGYVQVDPQFGDEGYIWHTRFDTIEYIDRTFPGRADERLDLFATMLFAVLTEFASPEP